METYLRKNYRADWDSESPIKIDGFGRKMHFAKIFRYLGLRKGAEIGVGSGRFSRHLCCRIPNIEMIGVDSWVPYEVARDGNPCCHHMRHGKNYQWARERLASNNIVLIRDTSMNAVKNIKENSLDFVYIDANHYYKYVQEDLTEWGKRVRSGGIISGHDYLETPNCDVIKAVNEYTKDNNIKRWFITSDSQPSFFWMNQ